MSTFSNVNPVVFGFMVIIPIAALWVTKAFFQMYVQMPDSVSYSNLVPFLYGFAIFYIIFALDLVDNNMGSVVKVYLPILIISLIATFLFASWAKSHFESNGYTQCPSETFKDKVFIVHFEKDGKCP